MTLALKHDTIMKNAMKICAFFIVLCLLTGCAGLKVGSESEWVASVQNCWPCTLYKAAFEAVSRLVKSLYPTMATKGLLVMGVGLLFWLSFTSAKMLTSMIEPNIKEYIRSVMVVLFKAMVVTAILSTGENFLCVIDLIVSPVLTTFTELSRIVLTANTNINNGLVWPEMYMVQKDGACDLFGGQISYQLQDIIFRVYVALNSGISLGYYVMVEKNFLNWIIGPFIMWMFFLMSLIFPLMFAESFIRLGAVIVLSPFFFAAWVFPSTKSAIKKAWDVVFGAMFQLLIGCIYIGLVVGVIQLFADNNWPGMLGNSRQTSDPGMLINFRRLSTEAISFFALILIMNRMQSNIPAIAGALGGDSSKSEIVAFMNGVKQLAISAAMIAAGAALSAFGFPGGAAMMSAGAQRMADQAQDAAKDAIAEVTDTGSGAGGGGSSGGGGSGGGSKAAPKGKYDESQSE